ncbi:MAG: hypothetical protein PHX68_01840 [Alphaproteobacteria bacterium]|nr:hypothetical protein [Alphaproteobacteria bacterium]
MMIVLYILLLFVLALIGTALAYRFCCRPAGRGRPAQSIPAGMLLVVLLAAVLCILRPGGDMLFFFAACLAMMGIATISERWPRLALEWFVCAVAGMIMPSTQIAFASVAAYTAFFLGSTLFWALMIEAFRVMDRVPFLSLLTTAATGLGIFILGIVFRLVPADIAVIALGVVSGVAGLAIAINVLFRSASLGPPAATLIGLLWGGFLYVLLIRGQTMAALLWPSYHLMEILIAGGMTLFLTRRFKCEVPFRIEDALRRMPARQVYRQVFTAQVLIALLLIVVMAQNMRAPALTGLLAAFLLFYTYSFLNGTIRKRLRYRDMLKDMRDGAAVFKDEVLHLSRPVQKKPPKAGKKTKKRTKKK